MTTLKQQLELHEADGSQFRPNQTMPRGKSNRRPGVINTEQQPLAAQRAAKKGPYAAKSPLYRRPHRQRQNKTGRPAGPKI